MQKAQSTNGSVVVTISRFGHEARTVALPDGATVAQALAQAGIALEGREEMFVEGVSADSTDVLENGDILSIVTPKQAG
jgi:sulfur carrier protein ThiS